MSGVDWQYVLTRAATMSRDAPHCCWRCLREAGLIVVRMIVCPECGNKRCPKASDHRYACTGSNEPGQPGSDYQ